MVDYHIIVVPTLISYFHLTTDTRQADSYRPDDLQEFQSLDAEPNFSPSLPQPIYYCVAVDLLNFQVSIIESSCGTLTLRIG